MTAWCQPADVPGGIAMHLAGSVSSAPDILVADDELLLLETLQDALEQGGYRVAVARQGLDALAALNRLARPALIVLDLQMPVMDGLKFLEELRRRPDHSDFGVVAMSALVDGQWVDHSTGVLRTLRKPFEVKELLDVAEAFFAHPPSAGSAAIAADPANPVLGPEAKVAGPSED
jgi:chemosensory pili system protein ChpA (sensor histidine kinase/response regulator)